MQRNAAIELPSLVSNGEYEDQVSLRNLYERLASRHVHDLIKSVSHSCIAKSAVLSQTSQAFATGHNVSVL